MSAQLEVFVHQVTEFSASGMSRSSVEKKL